jgi:hypothetical protein
MGAAGAGEPGWRSGQAFERWKMEKLKLVRRASGIHAVHGLDGEPLGVVDLSDLDLDDDELQSLMQKHADRKAAAGAVREFIAKVNAHMKNSGASYRQALCEVALADPVLASEYRRQVMLL